MAATLRPEGGDRAVQIAELPGMVRGYETVKLGNIKRYADALRELGIEPPSSAIA